MLLGSRRNEELLRDTPFVSEFRVSAQPPQPDDISVTVHFLGSLAMRAGTDMCRLTCLRGTPLVWLLGSVARTYPGFQEVLADEGCYVPVINGRRAYWWSDMGVDGELVLVPSVAFFDWPEGMKKRRKFSGITCLDVEGPVT